MSRDPVVETLRAARALQEEFFAAYPAMPSKSALAAKVKDLAAWVDKLPDDKPSVPASVRVMEQCAASNQAPPGTLLTSGLATEPPATTNRCLL